MGSSVVITNLEPLTASEDLRIDLRAQHIYRGLPSLIAWCDAGESTRNEFRCRAMSLMFFDGTLLHGTPPGGEDYGLAELQTLEAEASAVIRGELKAGEMWRPGASDAPAGSISADERDGVNEDGN